MPSIDEVVIRLRVENAATSGLADVRAGLNNLRSAAAGVSTDTSAAFESFGGVIDGFADKLINVGLKAMQDFAVKGVQTYAAFEDKMVNMQRIAQLSQADFAQLAENLRKISVTDLGGRIKADDLAVMAKSAVQAGVEGLANIEKFAVATAKTAKVLEITPQAASINMVRLTNLFSLAATDIERIGSGIARGEQKTSASAEDTLFITERISGTVKKWGGDINDAIAIAARMRDMAIPAERGASALERVMSRLASNSKKMAADLQLDWGTLQTAMNTGDVVGVVNQLETGFANLRTSMLASGASTDQVVARFNTIVGALVTSRELVAKMAMTHADAVTRGKDLLSLETEISNAYDAGTLVQSQFAERGQSQMEQWNAMGGKMSEVYRQTGENLKPATDLALQWGNALLDASLKPDFAPLQTQFQVLTTYLQGVLAANSQLATEAQTLGAELTKAMQDPWNAADGLKERVAAFSEELVKTAQSSSSMDTLWNTMDAGSQQIETLTDGMDGWRIEIDNATQAMQTQGNTTNQTIADSIAAVLENADAMQTYRQDIEDTSQTIAAQGDQVDQLKGHFSNLASMIGQVFNGMASAIANPSATVDRLLGKFQSMTAELKRVEDQSHGKSTFPGMAQAQEVARAAVSGQRRADVSAPPAQPRRNSGGAGISRLDRRESVCPAQAVRHARHQRRRRRNAARHQPRRPGGKQPGVDRRHSARSDEPDHDFAHIARLAVYDSQNHQRKNADAH